MQHQQQHKLQTTNKKHQQQRKQQHLFQQHHQLQRSIHPIFQHHQQQGTDPHGALRVHEHRLNSYRTLYMYVEIRKKMYII